MSFTRSSANARISPPRPARTAAAARNTAQNDCVEAAQRAVPMLFREDATSRFCHLLTGAGGVFYS